MLPRISSLRVVGLRDVLSMDIVYLAKVASELSYANGFLAWRGSDIVIHLVQ